MFPQLAANAIFSASIYLLVAMGFALVRTTCRFFNFSQAGIIALGPYLVFMWSRWVGVPLALAIPLGIVCCLVPGSFLEVAVYRPLRRRSSSHLVLMLASLGLYVFIENGIGLLFGHEAKTMVVGQSISGIHLLGARLTLVQLAAITLSVLTVLLLSVVLNATAAGRSLRSVASDPELAVISGISPEKVTLWAFLIASTLSATAGTILALDADMLPTMGLRPLLMGMVVAIIGGSNGVTRIAFGALLLGVAQNFGALMTGSQWQDATAFVLLAAFLLLRPQGSLGRNVKSTTA